MIRLSKLFSDHAVLQQGAAVPVWGWSCKDTFVSVVLKDCNGIVLADSVCRTNMDTGKFTAWLAPQTAGGPYVLTVEAEDGEKVTVSDIYIGEVWLAGGQSNMEMPLKGFQLPLLNRDKLKFHAPVRMLTVPREMTGTEREDVDAVWTLPEGEELENWSGVAAYFAAALTRELNVPVGILSSNWGGTVIQAWMSESSLIDAGVAPEDFDEKNLYLASRKYWDGIREKGIEFFRRTTPLEEIADFYVKSMSEDYDFYGNKGVEQGWHLADFDDSAWQNVDLPGGWKSKNITQESGVVWFRKKINIPENWIGRKLRLDIGACDKQDITYVNGIEVGATGTGLDSQYWDKLRSYEIPAELVSGRELSIAVRVFSWIFEGGMCGPAENMFIAPADDVRVSLPLAGSWLAGVEKTVPSVLSMGALGCYSGNSALYGEMLVPLAPYALKGVIWYQGESNSSEAERYFELMTTLMDDWRRLWRMKKMPFYQVLLAGYANPAFIKWPELREAQIQAAKATDTGFASAVDVGDAGDIHPLDKYTVGERLAAAALHDTYSRDIQGYGPEVAEVAWSDDDVKVLCFNAEGLHARSGNPGGWEIAGADGVFYEANAEIFGEVILLSSPSVPEPEEIRYAWDSNPVDANIYNSAGLPMIPCRFKR